MVHFICFPDAIISRETSNEEISEHKQKQKFKGNTLCLFFPSFILGYY